MALSLWMHRESGTAVARDMRRYMTYIDDMAASGSTDELAVLMIWQIQLFNGHIPAHSHLQTGRALPQCSGGHSSPRCHVRRLCPISLKAPRTTLIRPFRCLLTASIMGWAPKSFRESRQTMTR